MSDEKTQDDAIQKLDDFLVEMVTAGRLSPAYRLDQARAGLALAVLRGGERWTYRANLIERILNGARSTEAQSQD